MNKEIDMSDAAGLALMEAFGQFITSPAQTWLLDRGGLHLSTWVDDIRFELSVTAERPPQPAAT